MLGALGDLPPSHIPMTAMQTWRRWTLAACLLTLSAPAMAADPEVHALPVADRAPGERRPLLIFLHGLGGSGAEALANPELRALAERGRMFLVAPDGFVDREGRRFWNAGPACCNLDGKAVNDVARLEALIFHWRERPEIDPERVYIVGFSNGGFMAHRLACFMDDRLAAIVSIGGAGRAREEACGPTTPIAVAEIHGDADPVVAYGGGRIFNDHALDPHPSSRDTFHDWAERLGCLSQVGKNGKNGKAGKTGAARHDRRSRPAAAGRGNDDRELRQLPARCCRALDRPRRRAPGDDPRADEAGGRLPGRQSQGAEGRGGGITRREDGGPQEAKVRPADSQPRIAHGSARGPACQLLWRPSQ